MPTRNITRQATNPLAAPGTPTSVPLYVDSDDNRLKMIPAGSGSAEVVLQEANGAGSAEVLTIAKTLVAADSGKTYFLATAAGFAVTLPAPAIGLNYKFFIQVAPSGNYTIVTPGSPDQILAGQIYASSGGDEDSETAFTATTVNFIAAAGAGKIGDSADIWSDGTSWYARGFCDTAGGMTITG